MPQEVLSAFFCPAKTADDAEAMTIAWIPHCNSTKEAGLKPWFDYRHLHAFQRTYLWAERYGMAIKDCYAQTRDCETADGLRPFRGGDPRNTCEHLACWIARQKFDEIGVRYEFALRFVMTRFVNRGWHMMPRPNQLYGEELIMDIADAWAIEQLARLQLPIHPNYQISNYKGDRNQDEFIEYLANQIRQRNAKPQALATVMSQGYLDEDRARVLFGNDFTEQAIKYAALLC